MLVHRVAAGNLAQQYEQQSRGEQRIRSMKAALEDVPRRHADDSDRGGILRGPATAALVARDQHHLMPLAGQCGHFHVDEYLDATDVREGMMADNNDLHTVRCEPGRRGGRASLTAR